MNKFAEPALVDRNALRARLHARGIFPTRQRLRIAEVLLSRPQHVTADQLLQQINIDPPRVSRATVYNTLAAFVCAKLISVVNVPGGTVYFDSSAHGHAHLYNEDSGELSDLPLDAVAWVEQLALPQETELSGIDVLVRVRRKPVVR